MPFVTHTMEQLLRPHRSRSQDHIARAERPSPPLVIRLDRIHEIAVSVSADRRHRCEGMDLRSRLFGEIEVVLQQSVLRAVAATSHALTTLDTSSPGRADATEERIVYL